MGAGQHQLSERYERLAALAERELELVATGGLDELPALAEERNVLVASLPESPPQSARGPLERAAKLQAQTTTALAGALRELGGELERVERGRSMARGYGSPGGRNGRHVDHAA